MLHLSLEGSFLKRTWIRRLASTSTPTTVPPPPPTPSPPTYIIPDILIRSFRLPSFLRSYSRPSFIHLSAEQLRDDEDRVSPHKKASNTKTKKSSRLHILQVISSLSICADNKQNCQTEVHRRYYTQLISTLTFSLEQPACSFCVKNNLDCRVTSLYC